MASRNSSKTRSEEIFGNLVQFWQGKTKDKVFSLILQLMEVIKFNFIPPGLWASGSDRPQSVVSRERGWVVLPSRHDNWSPGDPHHREGGSAGPGWELRNQLLENLH